MPGLKGASYLHKSNIDYLFGFLEAYVICPSSLNKPVLPRRKRSASISNGSILRGVL